MFIISSWNLTVDASQCSQEKCSPYANKRRVPVAFWSASPESSAGDLIQSLGWEDPLDKEMEPTPVLLLENPQDSGAWQAIVHGVIKSQT